MREIVISDNEWHQIELAAGVSISTAAREEIREAIRKYLWRVKSRAPHADASVSRIERIRKAAATLQAVICESDPTQTEARDYADYLIKRGLRSGHDLDGVYEPQADALDSIATQAGRLVAACQCASNKIDDDPGLQSNRVWDWWVECVVEIIARHRLLPVAISNEPSKTKSGKPSPVVMAIKALQQQCFPDLARSHCQSDDALAKAINRALTDSRDT